MPSAALRTARLLAIVGYLARHGRASFYELAQHFDVSENQIRSDIELLWMTGTPGYMPNDLIDFDAQAFDEGIVKLTASRGLGTSLRLSTKESVAVLAALNACQELFDASDTDTRELVHGLIRKLNESLGDNARALDVQLTDRQYGDALRVLREAIAAQHPVDIAYSNVDDVASKRVIEPWAIFNEAGNLYVSAYCRSTNSERVFRLDRISEVHARVDEAFERTPEAPNTSLGNPTGGIEATVTLRPQGRWITEEVPHTGVTETHEGDLVMSLDVVRTEWFIRLICAHAPVIENVTPQVFQREAQARARAALAQYTMLADASHREN